MIEKIVARAQSNWTKAEGPHHHIVLSSRLRLARNLKKIPMPAFQNETDGFTVLEKVKNAAENLGYRGQEKLYFYRLNEIPALERQILLEKHLISPEHCEEGGNKGLLINGDEAISIMINEEDHLRLQVFSPGLQLEEAWQIADQLDDALESELEYAFHSRTGYLTACPTNVGTGLRASVMVHVPALVLTQQAGRVFSSLGQLGFTARGLYGEGTEAIGDLYQISNQITLGQTELEIIQNLTTLALQIVAKEEKTRKWLLQECPFQIKDRVGRAFGVLQNAAILNSQEALNCLSDVRMGVDLGLLKEELRKLNLCELLVLAQPAFIQRYTGRTMAAQERDGVRAELFAKKFR
ncbi:MAG: protein arginine kinase [Clostridia bacterium]|nr:protein arginine kinase [Clostridia bacterium]MDD4665993.1 protein arginine kinase [Clostridia bacterium]